MSNLNKVTGGRAGMPEWQTLLFACCSGLSVANVYYAQPLLDALALEFSFAPAAAGRIIFATQAGCVLALLLLVPLGDSVNRRWLMRGQLLGLVAALLLVATAGSGVMLMLAMLLTGMLGTAMTQGMIAYAAAAAAPAERGRIVGTVSGGVIVGLLLARVVAGGVADVAGWRGVYFFSAVMMLLTGAAMWQRLPELPDGQATRWREALLSVGTLLGSNRVLQQRGVLALLMFAGLSIFWSALVLMLRQPPWQLSHAEVGAFGLAGAASALIAARAGRRADRGLAEQTSGAALMVLLLSWLPLWLGQDALWLLLVGILMLDAGAQALHVTSQSLIFASQNEAGGRMIAAYMLFYSIGSGLGALVSTEAFAYGGWGAVCLCGAAVNLLALVYWWLMRLSRSAAAETSGSVCSDGKR